ncbi:hypothetical protein C8Q77DRAFT_121053 [Trametes polyzona]|nr:hypothetical protein C8Q77DRAFT_121053 [Trametes polyzona]
MGQRRRPASPYRLRHKQCTESPVGVYCSCSLFPPPPPPVPPPPPLAPLPWNCIRLVSVFVARHRLERSNTPVAWQNKARFDIVPRVLVATHLGLERRPVLCPSDSSRRSLTAQRPLPWHSAPSWRSRSSKNLRSTRRNHKSPLAALQSLNTEGTPRARKQASKRQAWQGRRWCMGEIPPLSGLCTLAIERRLPSRGGAGLRLFQKGRDPRGWYCTHRVAICGACVSLAWVCAAEDG